jgi:two-component system, chemotaxis family, sensor kinase CheA
MIENEDLLQSFVEEANGHIETLELSLVNMNIESTEAEDINTIFRSIHSIKGCAGFFNLTKIVALSHEMESLLGEVRSGKICITAAMIDRILVATDCLKSMIEDVGNSEEVDVKQHIDEISAFLNPHTGYKNEAQKTAHPSSTYTEVDNQQKEMIENAISEGYFYFKLSVHLNEHLLKYNINPIEIIKMIKSIGIFIELKTCMVSAADETPDVVMDFYFMSVLERRFMGEALNVEEEYISELTVEAPQETQNDEIIQIETKKELAQNKEEDLKDVPKDQEKKSQSIAVEDSIRVHIGVLNDLLNLTSEMVLGRNQLLRAMEAHKKGIGGIDSILQNIDHITTQLQEKVMQTRMRPCSNVFNKFPRIIRDLAKKLNKEIDLKLEGSDVELDKSIIEALGDPLTHLIRNSADHGLEMPEVRLRQGKSRVGNISIKAYHEGGYVNIDVTDDGAGINVERIRNKAIEKGLTSAGELSNMTEQEILTFLFRPGFSTAEEVTDLSGRGVGMDVVKTNIEKLGGTIEIFTEEARGTTFRLLLPLTLAIIPSLIVEASGERFALPQVNLQEIVRIKPGDVNRRIEFINNNEVLRLRGRLLPIVHLADVIGLKRVYFDGTTNEYKEERRKSIIRSYSETPPKMVKRNRSRKLLNILRILVISIGSKKIGLAVDVIHGGEEILVKPTPAFIKDCKCYSGVTIMGDGKVAMILDPKGIIEKANLRFTDENNEKAVDGSMELAEKIREHQNLLLFKGLNNETMALDMALISRVEEIQQKDIEHIGEMQYIKFRGDLLRVIHAEEFLGLCKHKNNRRRDKNAIPDPEKKLYVIIPKLTCHPIGILTDLVKDTVQMKIDLNHEDKKIKGMIGSAILNQQIILLINLYELLEMADPTNFEVEKLAGTKEIKILLVEDTPFFLKLERDYLIEAGYDVVTAVNGKEALNYLQEHDVDAVVSDVNMPVMDGLELVKRIRADKKLEKLPVMAVTSLCGELQKKSGLEAGFDSYELKLDRATMLQTLKKVCELRR